MTQQDDCSSTPTCEETLSSWPLKEFKATQGMQETLERLHALLRCPLCHQVFVEPTTLSSCAHSFCVACIDEYCCNAWTCPVKGCGMPMSVVGGHKGSYRKVNPQLRQFTTSLDIMCQSLNRAPDNWWKVSGDKSSDEFENPLSDMESFAMHLPGMEQFPMDTNPADSDYCDDGNDHGIDDDDDDENDDELIDLQQDEMVDLQQDE